MPDNPQDATGLKIPYQKRLQGIVKGVLLRDFCLYCHNNEIKESEMVRDAVREKLIRENAHKVGRVSGNKSNG